jgi:hydroxyacylglutathione hydrolase
MTDLTIHKVILGPVSTNCYLLADPSTDEAVVIDPAWDGMRIFQVAGNRGWRVTQLWYTHAHFDHFAGTAALVHQLGYTPSIALHPGDSDLWKSGGGSSPFGFQLDPGPEPDIDLSRQQSLPLGVYQFRVFHTPGHSPGSCMYYCATEQVVFTGDLIFYHSIGRTDLPGGDWEALQASILNKVYTLPEETRILPGHGDETTVREEKDRNPFIHP